VVAGILLLAESRYSIDELQVTLDDCKGRCSFGPKHV
jgi:hypothetical protein